jgi:hypothetical protein
MIGPVLRNGPWVFSTAEVTAVFFRYLLVPAAVLMCLAAVADAQSAPGADEPLPESERQQITLDLIQRYPELASSPGVKAASAPPPDTRGSVVISVIYYPHAERHGIKEAFEALCAREYPSTTWTCDDVSIRRYLQMESQDWEVRIRGDISAQSALALIDGSRRDLRAGITDASRLPSTAIMIVPHTDGDYRITWGLPGGQARLTMLACLADGGDANNPDDWHATVFTQ